MKASLIAIDYHFPEKCLTNDDLSLEFPEYDFSKFESKVGIKKRYIAGKDETALDLAVTACLKLFDRVDKNEIDYILFCTQSPDYKLPTTACILQDKLQLRKNIGAFDFNLGCSGYTYGLSIAKSLVESALAKNVLLVTAETYSKYLHPKDRSNRSIFGDAATASLISCSDTCMIGNFLFGTDGSGYDKLIIKNGASKSLCTKTSSNDDYLYMNGPDIFNFTTEIIPNFTFQILEKNNLQIKDVSNFIFHQANAFMLNFIRKQIKVSSENFYINLEEGGNTVSCTIPIALKQYTNSHNFNKMEEIVLVGFGVGLSWCGGTIKIEKKL